MDELQKYREEIDKIDSQLLTLIAKRLDIVKKVGVFKKKHNLPILDQNREKMLLQTLKRKAQKHKVDFYLIKKIWNLLFRASYKIEE